MKKILIGALACLCLMSQSMANPTPDNDTRQSSNRSYWIQPDIMTRGIVSVFIGAGLSGGVAFFNKRLALGVDGYLMFHLSVERHLGLYMRVVPLKFKHNQNVYLIGRVHRGSLFVMGESGDAYWNPLNTYSYGIGATINFRPKANTHPSSIEVTCRTLFEGNLCLPGIAFGQIF